jgi:uncharacterized membrane protein
MGLGSVRHPATTPGANPAGVPNYDSARLVVVDVARVVAILFMIQGHALDVLLAPQFRQGALYDGWLFLRGLTAPMFLMFAGVSFTLASLRRWSDYRQPSSKLFRHVTRFAFFVFLGYAMHLPAGTLRNFHNLDAASWQAWFQVDVLQCIGLTLIALQLLVLLAGTPRRMALWSAGLGSAIILLTPLAWIVDWGRFLPAPVAAYFNSQSGSLFPLFPWAGYVFFGAACGYVLRQRSATPGKITRLFVVGGAALLASGILLSKPVAALYTDLDFWKTSPTLFLIRAGCVGLLLALFSRVTPARSSSQRAWRWLAQESLLIYFVHVCILYGSIWNLGLRQWIGPTLAPLPTLGWICLLVVAMMLLGWTWSWFKRAEPRRSYVLRFAVLILAIAHPWI